MRHMALNRRPRRPATKISGIAGVLALLAASFLGAVHQLWPAVILVVLILGGGYYLETRYSRRHGPTNRG